MTPYSVPGMQPGGFAQPQVVDYGAMMTPTVGDCCNGYSGGFATSVPGPSFPNSTLPGDYPTITPPNVPMNPPRTMPGVEMERDGSTSRFKLPVESDGNRGTVVVRLPANGKLFVEGRPLTVTNGERTFVTPPLPTDRDAVYAFKAEFDRNGETHAVTRSVRIRAGGSTRVDFTDTTVSAPMTLPAVPEVDPKSLLGTTPLFNAKTTTKAVPEQPTVRPPAGLDRAKITVHLPPSATLFVNGAKNDRTDLVREFSTPPLTAGKVYKYTMRTEVVRNGLPESQEQTIEFRPGDSLTVDFRLPAPTELARSQQGR
jgi:uncharacterized protein (TIGR03000 family)